MFVALLFWKKSGQVWVSRILLMTLSRYGVEAGQYAHLTNLQI
jgi:hypothetical protein